MDGWICWVGWFYSCWLDEDQKLLYMYLKKFLRNRFESFMASQYQRMLPYDSELRVGSGAVRITRSRSSALILNLLLIKIVCLLARKINIVCMG